jgi:DNA-binding NtrC family response regulator
MTLFCDGKVIMPEHVHFPPDIEMSERLTPAPETNGPLDNHVSGDLSLASAVQRHVRFVYKQANGNQRRTARMLGISRATLSRHLRAVNHD